MRDNFCAMIIEFVIERTLINNQRRLHNPFEIRHIFGLFRIRRDEYKGDCFGAVGDNPYESARRNAFYITHLERELAAFESANLCATNRERFNATWQSTQALQHPCQVIFQAYAIRNFLDDDSEFDFIVASELQICPQLLP